MEGKYKIFVTIILRFINQKMLEGFFFFFEEKRCKRDEMTILNFNRKLSLFFFGYEGKGNKTKTEERK